MMNKEDVIIKLLEEMKSHSETRFDGMQRQFGEKFEGMGKQFEGMQRQFDGKFDSMQRQFDGKFEGMGKQFNTLQKSVDRIEQNQFREKERLDQVYDAREKVKIEFGWQWGMVSFFIALLAVGFSKVLA